MIKKRVNKDDNFIPRVSVIIAAYNEERSIRDRLDNVLSLDYPTDSLEIIVTSDCSDDNTDDIVKEYADRNVILYRNSERVGKTEAQNKAVEISSGSILLFSDATTYFNRDIIKKIVRNFADPAVGCVEGKLVFVRDMRARDVSENGIFTRIELLIREKESCINSVLGVSGCVYAVRRSVYQPMDRNLVSDLAISFIVNKQGYRVIHESEAIAFEEYVPDIMVELRRNTRTICQGWSATWTLLNSCLENKSLLRGWVFIFQFFSHKVLRWLSPFMLLSVLTVNLIIVLKSNDVALELLLYIQILYYIISAVLIFFKIWFTRPFTLLNSGICFMLYNIAGLLGFCKYVKGEKKFAWSTAR